MRRSSPDRSRFKVGQVLWAAVAADDPPARGKKMEDTRLVPVVLDLVTAADIDDAIATGRRDQTRRNKILSRRAGIPSGPRARRRAELSRRVAALAHPNQPHLVLAMAHERRGNSEEAQKWWAQSVRMLDRPPPSAHVLGTWICQLLRREAASLFRLADGDKGE